MLTKEDVMLRFRCCTTRWLCIVTLSLGSYTASSPSVAQNDPLLPTLRSSSEVVSNEEIRLGQAWLRQFRARVPQWQDPISHYYLDRLIARLAPYSQIGGLSTQTLIVDSPSLNAFAVPGGIIGVNTGLFAFAADEGAFASVLAHEMGHLSQRHYARGSARAEQNQLPAMAGMLAGLLLAASGAGEAGMAAAMSSQAAVIQDQLAYSRRFEEEADRVGLQTLAAAGYAPEDMVRMFRAMLNMARLQGNTPPEFMLTHPITESRLSDTQARAAQLEVSNRRDNNLLYGMMRGRALLHIHANNPQDALTRLKAETPDPDAVTYLEALIMAENGQTEQSLQALDRLAHQHPDFTALPASAANVAFEARRYTEAISRSQQLLRLVPNYLPAQLIMAEAQLQRDPQTAFAQLRDITTNHPDTPYAFNLLADAAGRSGHNGWGHLARAEYLQLTGRVDRGIQQLAIARDAAEQEGDNNLLGRIAQRRDAFISYREALDKF
nr:M48 family metalloprotease [Halomonas azerica]